LDQSSTAATHSTPAEKKSPSTHERHTNSHTATTTTNEYANELLLIKQELSKLKALITTVVAQFTMTIESLKASSSSPHHPTTWTLQLINPPHRTLPPRTHLISQPSSTI